jgi:hypothetical protein
LGIIISNYRGLERLVIFGILQRADDCFGCQSMPDGVATRCVLPSFRSWPSAFERIPAIGLDLPV